MRLSKFLLQLQHQQDSSELSYPGWLMDHQVLRWSRLVLNQQTCLPKDNRLFPNADGKVSKLGE